MADETPLQRRARDIEAQSLDRREHTYKYIPQERAEREYVDSGSGTTLWTYVQTIV